MSPHSQRLSLLALLALLSGCGPGEGPANDEEPLEEEAGPGRLFVADAHEPHVHVYDLAESRVIARFETAGPARLYRGNDFNVYAVQSAQDRVQAFRAGFEAEAHGDHIHYHREAPAPLDFTLTGPRPVHFVAHEGWLAFFHDGDGSATLVQEQRLGSPGYTPAVLRSSEAHHGVAVPLGGHVLMSIPHPDADKASPVGVEVRTLAGDTRERFESCPGLHGEASRGAVVGFGCADGVLLVRQEAAGRFTAAKVPNPPEAAPGTRVGTLAAHPAFPHFIGNWGPQALVRIDETGGTLTPIALPGRSLQFAFTPDGQRLLVLTADGRLHRVDPSTGTVEAGAEATSPVGDTTAPTPQFAVGEGSVFVTDPARGRVTQLALDSLQVTAQHALGGAPAKLVLVSLESTGH